MKYIEKKWELICLEANIIWEFGVYVRVQLDYKTNQAEQVIKVDKCQWKGKVII